MTYTEDDLVEQPAIALFDCLDWNVSWARSTRVLI